jgi:hypothetical protein
MLLHNPLLNRTNRRLQSLKLCRQYNKACASIVRQILIVFIGDDRQQLFDAFTPLRSDDPELGQVGPHGVDQLCALLHQQIAGTMLHQLGLLLGRLHLDEAHGRTPHGLANRLSVGSIVLVALDVGLYVLCRH